MAIQGKTMRSEQSALLTYNLDVFFNEQISKDMLESLADWAGYPVSLGEVKRVDYKNGDSAYFICISTQPEAADKIIETLWRHLKIPLIAYGGLVKTYDYCVRWLADDHGIHSTAITVNLAKS